MIMVILVHSMSNTLVKFLVILIKYNINNMFSNIP